MRSHAQQRDADPKYARVHDRHHRCDASYRLVATLGTLLASSSSSGALLRVSLRKARLRVWHLVQSMLRGAD